MQPSATLTFLFTDIEGSTRRWEQWPVAMAAALARHDALVADALAAHGGTVFKTVGDAFCALFPGPAPALAAALDAQRALAAEDWSAFGAELPAVSVRMAIHSGPAELRGGDYFGPAVNRVARLLGAGHGGQVLLSAVAAELVADVLPGGVTLCALGRHRLKDLAEPVEVFQAVAPGLVAEFAPLASLDRVRHNLPHQATSFVGRASELTELRAKLATASLITVTGPGGTGKTRLAQQLAAECLDDFPDGIFFVDLAPLTEPSLAPAVALQAMGLPSEPGRPAQDTLLDFLQRHPRLVLVLDNCEHLLDGAAALAHAVMSACPEVRLVATSREPLAVAGEIVWPLAPLSTPSPQSSPTPDTLAAYDAVRLFVDRAEAALPGFAVTDANAAAVAHICHRLDGIPLAIELAAARVRLFSPAELAERLDARFLLLTRGNRAALPRHQTLRACLDWSYDLLPDAERRVFERLGVFAGHIPFAAAARVCAADDVDADALLDALIGLEAKSLVVADRSGGPSTVRLLETMRAYARERLAESGDETATRDRHLAWCLALAREAEPHYPTAEGPSWLRRVARQYDDLLAALDWGLPAAGPAEDLHRSRQAIELSQALNFYWGETDHRIDALAWHRRAIEPARRLGDQALLAQALFRSVAIDELTRLADPNWLAEPYGEAVSRVRISGDDRAAAALIRLGRALLSGDERLPNLLADLGLEREAGWVIQDAAAGLFYGAGDLDGAERLFRYSLDVKSQARPLWHWDMAINYGWLGEIYRARHQTAESLEVFNQALDLFSIDEGLGTHRGSSLFNRAQVLISLGQPERAVEDLHVFVSQARMRGHGQLALTGLPAFAAAASRLGRVRRAARLFGATVTLWRAAGDDFHGRRREGLGPADWEDFAQVEAASRALLLPEDWDRAFAQGAAMSDEAALAYAMDEIDPWSDEDG